MSWDAQREPIYIGTLRNKRVNMTSIFFTHNWRKFVKTGSGLITDFDFLYNQVESRTNTELKNKHIADFKVLFNQYTEGNPRSVILVDMDNKAVYVSRSDKDHLVLSEYGLNLGELVENIP